MNSSELTGPALDWAVAKARGALTPIGNVVLKGNKRLIIVVGEIEEPTVVYEPSMDDCQGGPIIDEAGIGTSLRYGSLPPNHVQDVWDAVINPEFYTSGRPMSGVRKQIIASGPTRLVAAMRCYVIAKLGNEIDLPKELVL